MSWKRQSLSLGRPRTDRLPAGLPAAWSICQKVLELNASLDLAGTVPHDRQCKWLMALMLHEQTRPSAEGGEHASWTEVCHSTSMLLQPVQLQAKLAARSSLAWLDRHRRLTFLPSAQRHICREVGWSAAPPKHQAHLQRGAWHHSHSTDIRTRGGGGCNHHPNLLCNRWSSPLTKCGLPRLLCQCHTSTVSSLARACS